MSKLSLAACALALAIPFFASQGDTNVPEPRFNDVFRIATHNSYWVHRSPVWDPFASGVQERLLDQLLFDRARGLEIDLHKSRSRAHDWRVYHTDIQGDSLCTPFSECLKQLEQFQYALPRHEPLTVILELKEILEHNFDEVHTPADLDRLLERRLGAALFRPRDLLSRCAPGLTLRECVARTGWPTVRELRGKILFTVLGNWRWCTIGHGPSGWAAYATWRGPGEDPSQPAVNARSAFPMESDWGDWSQDGCGNEGIPEPGRDEARQGSIFLQEEDLGTTGHLEKLPEFLAKGGLVRVDSPPTLANQAAAYAEGFQMFQSDYPWFEELVSGTDRAQAFRPLHPESFAQPELREPGERLFAAGSEGSAFFAARRAIEGFSDWETFVSTTRRSTDAQYPNPLRPGGQGCLRAESADGTQSASLCRQVTPDHWGLRGPRGQLAAVSAELRRHGLVTYRHTFYSGERIANGVGDQLRMTIWPDGPAGSCVSLMSAAEMQAPEQPRWTVLRTHCFTQRLERQGLEVSRGDALFVRARHDGLPVRAAELAPTDGATPYRLEDHSVF